MSGTFAIATFAMATAPTVSVTTSPTVIPPITIGLNSCFGYTTAGDLIRRALFHILVDASESTLQPDEYADGLNILNAYMDDLEANNIRLGYEHCCNIADIVNIPNGAMRGVAAGLAIDLAPMFGGRVTAALIKQADEGLKTLYKLGVKVGVAQFPFTMPRPSSYANLNLVYVAPTPFAVMTMAGNRRVTDIQAQSEALKVNGFWNVESFYSLTPDLSGRITNRGEGLSQITVYAEFNVKASGTTSGGVIGITRNNALELYVENVALSTTPVSALITGTIALEAGDFIDIVVGDTAGTKDITLIDSLVRLTCQEQFSQ
jgi:hypothetical protein